MTIEILDKAEDDLVNGSRFYEQQQAGLGAYFRENLCADIDSLRIHGGVHRLVYRNYHRALSKRFPLRFSIRFPVKSFNSCCSRLPAQASVDHRTSEIGLAFGYAVKPTRSSKLIVMKRVKLDSLAIDAVKYDEKKRTLDVEFRDGDTYRYMHVPEFVYRELLKAESAGAFWNAIKDQFDYVRLE